MSTAGASSPLLSAAGVAAASCTSGISVSIFFRLAMAVATALVSSLRPPPLPPPSAGADEIKRVVAGVDKTISAGG